MADARVGWHHPEAVEGLLTPPEELVALLVAVELHPGVEVEGVVGAEPVDDHGVVDHELGRDVRIHPRRVAAQGLDAVAHGGEVDHRRHAGEVLHQDPRRGEDDLVVGLRLGVPPGQRLDVLRGHRLAVLVAEQVLQQDLQRVRQPLHGELSSADMSKIEYDRSDGQAAAAVETVATHERPLPGGIQSCALPMLFLPLIRSSPIGTSS